MEQKKIVLFILIVHLAAFLAGCSGNKNSGNNDSSDLWNKLSSKGGKTKRVNMWSA